MGGVRATHLLDEVTHCGREARGEATGGEDADLKEATAHNYLMSCPQKTQGRDRLSATAGAPRGKLFTLGARCWAMADMLIWSMGLLVVVEVFFDKLVIADVCEGFVEHRLFQASRGGTKMKAKIFRFPTLRGKHRGRRRKANT